MTASAASPGPARGPWIASAALAVAIVVAAALAVVTLVTAPVSPASSTGAAAPAPAPAAPAPSPAPPAAAPAPAGGPAVTDAAGRALPPAVATGVQGLYTALGTGDMAGIQSRYQPSAAVDAAPWSRVAPLLAQPANREQMLAALRQPPQRLPGIYRYAGGGARVGVDAQGRMAYLSLT